MYFVRTESTVLQKPHSFCLVCVILAGCSTVLSVVNIAQGFQPDSIIRLQIPRHDEFIDAPFPELHAYANRTKTLVPTTTDIGLGIAFVRQPATVLELNHSLRDFFLCKIALLEFMTYFSFGVLTPGEQFDRSLFSA